MLYAALLADRTLVSAPVLSRIAWAVPIEFAVIHASGFLMWPWLARWEAPRRATYVVVLAVLYTIPLAILAFATGHWYPLTIFWGLMVNRMLRVIVSDSPDDASFMRLAIAWAGATTIYVFALMIGAVAAPSVMTRALLIGFGYFTAVGVSELSDWEWVDRWMARARARG